MTTIDRFHRRLPASALLLIAAIAAPALAAQGTLQYGKRVYYSTGCVHNGNRAVCSFLFINQGVAATLNAGIAGSELTGIQFVDNAHVPHRADAAYFLDQFGTQQNQLFLNHNDKGMMTVEFATVDPAVSFGEFHLRDQVVAGIQVTQPNYNAPGGGAPNGGVQPAGTTQFAAAVPQAQQQPQMPQTAATQQPCIAQNGNTAICNAQNKMANGTTQVTQTASAIGQMTGALKGIFGGGQPAPAAQQAPQPQPVQQLPQQPQQIQQLPQQQAPPPQQSLTPQQLQQLQLQQQLQQLQQQQAHQ